MKSSQYQRVARWVSKRRSRFYSSSANNHNQSSSSVGKPRKPDKRSENSNFGQRSRKNGMKYAPPLQTLFDYAPRIRVRNLSDRQKEQLGELVLLNERLAGRPVPEARHRIDFLKRRREVWEQIYNYVTKQDAFATLAALEEAHRQVAIAIDGSNWESKSVTALKKELVALQNQVTAAHEQLHHTQDLVNLNIEKIQQTERNSQRAHESEYTEMTTLPAGLPTFKNEQAWLPVEFAIELREGAMKAFSHFGRPWILFRDDHGDIACIEDCCAHRACPLSLGKVVGGQVMCAYHGWKYNRQGECTEMPSTMMCPGIHVDHLACKESDGFIWISDPAVSTSQEPHIPVGLPEQYVVVASFQTLIPTAAQNFEMSILRRGSMVRTLCLLPKWLHLKSHLFSVPTLTCTDSPGWIVGRSRDIFERHIYHATDAGDCHWLCQIAVRKRHWSCAAPKHLWQQFLQKAVEAHRSDIRRRIDLDATS